MGRARTTGSTRSSKMGRSSQRELEHAEAELEALRQKVETVRALCREAQATGGAFDSQQTLAKRVLNVLNP